MNLALIAVLLLQSEAVRTDHFEVVSTYRNRAYLQEVAEALESGHAAMTGTLGRKPEKDPRYRVELLATLKEYEDKDREMNEGRFAANMAFSHPKTGITYVALQPRSGAPLMDRTRALFRHEAFHLMTYRHAAWMIDAPEWLAEGLAERAAEQNAEADLNFADAVTLTRSMIAWKRAWSLVELITSSGSSHKEFLKRWTWYSQSWLLVKFLIEKRKEPWSRFMKRLSDGPGDRPRANKILLEEMGETAEDLEASWFEWIGTLKAAPWRRIDGDWRLAKDGVEGVAFPRMSAYLMSDTTLRKRKYTVKAEAQVASLGSGQVDLVLIPADEDHGVARIIKSTLSRAGVATVLQRSKGVWKREAWQNADPALVAPDRWVRLEMEVDGDTIRLRADGKLRVEHTFKGDAFPLDDVRWGVGNYDSWTKFRAIEVLNN